MPKISREKRETRRRQIIAAAGRCFARQGFHRTSMQDIVRESKLSPGAIYCYFRGKHDIVEAIANQRHSRESALLAGLLACDSLSEGLRELGAAFFEMLRDPKERQRHKVTIQIWAESLRDPRIRKIIERGLRQRDALTAALRKAHRAGELPADLDADSLSRVMLALLQGFILQQAWEPGLDARGYLKTASSLWDAAFGATPAARPPPDRSVRRARLVDQKPKRPSRSTSRPRRSA